MKIAFIVIALAAYAGADEGYAGDEASGGPAVDRAGDVVGLAGGDEMVMGITICMDQPASGLNLEGKPAACDALVTIGACTAGPDVLSQELVLMINENCKRSCGHCGVMGDGNRPGFKYDALYDILYAQMKTEYAAMDNLRKKIAAREASDECIQNPYSAFCRSLHSEFFGVQQPLQSSLTLLVQQQTWMSRACSMSATLMSKVDRHEEAVELARASITHYMNKRDLNRLHFEANLKEYQDFAIERANSGAPADPDNGQVELIARENVEETKSLVQAYLSLLHLQNARASTSPEKRQMLAALNRAYRAPPRPITPAGYTLQSYQAQIISKIPPNGAAATIDTLPATVTAEYLHSHYIAELRPFKISKGVYDNWPAMQKWTKSGLLKHYAGVTVNASTRGAAPQYFINGVQDQTFISFKAPGAQQAKAHAVAPIKIGMAWDDQFSWDCEIKPLVPGQTSPPFPGSTVGRSCMAAQVAGTWDDVFTAAAEAKKAGATTLFIYGQGVNVAALGPAPMSMAAAVQVAILNEATGHQLANFARTGGTKISVRTGEHGPPPGMDPSQGGGASPEMLDAMLRDARRSGDPRQPVMPLPGSDEFAEMEHQHKVDVGRLSGEGEPKVEMTVKQYVEELMTTTGNSSHPEVRYVFNTMGNGVQAGYGQHPFRDDFSGTPQLILDAIDGVLAPGSGYFQFFLGAALTGAVPHYHNSAWNALVHGKKHWVLIPPDKYNMKEFQNKEDDPTHPPLVPSYASAYTWFKKALPAIRKKYPGVIYEFIQEEGELVWIPPNYGHAILNLQPSIGVAETLGAYNVSSHSWEKSKSIKALVDLADGVTA